MLTGEQDLLERALKGAPKVALPLPIVACDAGKNLVAKTAATAGPGNAVRLSLQNACTASTKGPRTRRGRRSTASAARALIFVCGSRN